MSYSGVEFARVSPESDGSVHDNPVQNIDAAAVPAVPRIVPVPPDLFKFSWVFVKVLIHTLPDKT